MEWAFGDFVLSRDRAELIGPDGPVHVEKQTLNLLLFLVRNAGRVVSKDDIIEAVWNGRIVGDSTISTAIKQARRAVGDTGSAQDTIRTVHGLGFRFVAPVRSVEPVGAAAAALGETAAPPEPLLPEIGIDQASLAVLRFQFFGGEDDLRGPTLADAIPAELIVSLSRLRWLHIIARGSSFRFDPATALPEEVSAKLRVRYLMTGSSEAIGDMLTISIEVLSAADGSVLWSERFATQLADIEAARRDIVASAVSALELHIPNFEADHARRLSPTQLDAWSHYHLGLRHIYRFNAADNEVASRHFRTALDLDRDFARAHAGLSFTYWQQAFMLFGEDRRGLLENAAAAAARALEIDAHDPFANYNMGRARWLQGDLDASFDWLDRALLINPCFAQCHYTKGLNKVFVGAFDESLSGAERAISLSPIDPLLYGMYGTQALSLIGIENFEEAARLAEKAAQLPGAHFYISMIAAAARDLQGDRKSAERWSARVGTSRPDASAAMFFEAFPVRDKALRHRLGGALERLGLA